MHSSISSGFNLLSKSVHISNDSCFGITPIFGLGWCISIRRIRWSSIHSAGKNLAVNLSVIEFDVIRPINVFGDDHAVVVTRHARRSLDLHFLASFENFPA